MGTHIAGVARRQNLRLNVKISIDAEFFSEGSLLRGDRRAGAESISVNVIVEGDHSPEFVERLVKEAEAGCFTINALRNPSPVTVSATLNGTPLPGSEQSTEV
jgi:organic hydroperoxide reductase OsmC/OhrA